MEKIRLPEIKNKYFVSAFILCGFISFFLTQKKDVTEVSDAPQAPQASVDTYIPKG